VTAISYKIPIRGQFTIAIFDITGKLIKTLTTNKQSAGQGIVQWNGRNDTGISLPSGVYNYQLSSSDFTSTRKIVLLK
jgi:flagellar hook assembly protein FlgD